MHEASLSDALETEAVSEEVAAEERDAATEVQTETEDASTQESSVETVDVEASVPNRSVAGFVFPDERVHPVQNPVENSDDEGRGKDVVEIQPPSPAAVGETLAEVFEEPSEGRSAIDPMVDAVDGVEPEAGPAAADEIVASAVDFDSQIEESTVEAGLDVDARDESLAEEEFDSSAVESAAEAATEGEPVIGSEDGDSSNLEDHEPAEEERSSSPALWFDPEASEEEMRPLEGDGDPAADLAQFEAIVESQDADLDEAQADAGSVTPSDLPEVVGGTVEVSDPPVSEAWADVLAGNEAVSEEAVDRKDESMPVEAEAIELEPVEEAADRIVASEEETTGDDTSFGDAVAEVAERSVSEAEEDLDAGEEDEVGAGVEESHGEASVMEEAARFIFPTPDQPSVELESGSSTEQDVELEASAAEGDEEGSTSAAMGEEAGSWSSSGYSFGDSSESEAEIDAELEAESEVGIESGTESEIEIESEDAAARKAPDGSESELRSVASSLSDPPLPRAAALASGLSSAAESVETAVASAFDATTPSAGLPTEEPGEVSTYQAFESGSARAKSASSLGWLWIVAVVALLAVGGWLWFRSGAESTSAETPNPAASSASESPTEAARSSSDSPTSGGAGDAAAALGEGADATAPVTATPAPGAAEEPDLESLIDEEFGEREREIRERFEIERKRLEEQLEALRSQRVQDSTGTSQR